MKLLTVRFPAEPIKSKGIPACPAPLSGGERGGPLTNSTETNRGIAAKFFYVFYLQSVDDDSKFYWYQ